MGQFVDLTGLQFGLLKAVCRAGSDNHGATWNCVCECGKKLIVKSNSLRSENTRSCGSCLHKTHGGSYSRLYRIHRCMRARCYDERSDSFKHYGAKGIRVCDLWMDFAEFQTWALANGYQDGLSIDRIDGTLGYSPDNCRWATPRQQQHNIRSNVRLTAYGKTMTIAEWARLANMPYSTLYGRVNAGWDVYRAIGDIDDKAHREAAR